MGRGVVLYAGYNFATDSGLGIAIFLSLGVQTAVALAKDTLLRLLQAFVGIFELDRRVYSVRTTAEAGVHMAVHICAQIAKRGLDITVIFVSRIDGIAQYDHMFIIVTQRHQAYNAEDDGDTQKIPRFYVAQKPPNMM